MLTLFQSGTVVAVASGYGRNAVRDATRSVIATFHPSLVVSAGVADALYSDFRWAEEVFVVPEEILDTHTGARLKTLAGRGVLATIAGRVAIVLAPFDYTALDLCASIVGEVAQETNTPMIAVKILLSHGCLVDFRPHDWLDSEGEPTRVRAFLRLLMAPRVWLLAMNRSISMRWAAPKLTQKLNHLIRNGTLEDFDFQKLLGSKP